MSWITDIFKSKTGRYTPPQEGKPIPIMTVEELAQCAEELTAEFRARNNPGDEKLFRMQLARFIALCCVGMTHRDSVELLNKVADNINCLQLKRP
jgi:hypothetical protein